MKIKITILAAIMLASAAFGQSPATLSVVSVTQNDVTLQLTAGSQQIVGGFDIIYKFPGGLEHLVTFSDTGDCSLYDLHPGDSVQFTIDGLTNSECVFYSDPHPLTCGRQVRFTERHHSGGHSQSVTVQTAGCE